MKKSVFKLIIVLFFSIIALFFCSCENELRIRANLNGVDFSYRIAGGQAFFDLMAFDEEAGSAFDEAQIKSTFVKAGFTGVNVVCPTTKSVEIKAGLPESANDPVSKSGMLRFSLQENYTSITISNDTLMQLYSELPEELQNMIDMFMAPAFTGEEMTNEEYLNLIASIYGQKMADEIQASKITIILEAPGGGVSRHTISLVRLLNLTGKLELRA